MYADVCAGVCVGWDKDLHVYADGCVHATVSPACKVVCKSLQERTVMPKTHASSRE